MSYMCEISRAQCLSLDEFNTSILKQNIWITQRQAPLKAVLSVWRTSVSINSSWYVPARVEEMENAMSANGSAGPILRCLSNVCQELENSLHFARGDDARWTATPSLLRGERNFVCNQARADACAAKSAKIWFPAQFVFPNRVARRHFQETRYLPQLA